MRGHKWSAAQHAKFKASMKARKITPVSHNHRPLLYTVRNGRIVRYHPRVRVIVT